MRPRSPASCAQGVAHLDANQLVLDPFSGSGTTAVAAKELKRFFVGAELEKEFAELAAPRIKNTQWESVLREISSLHAGGGGS